MGAASDGGAHVLPAGMVALSARHTVGTQELAGEWWAGQKCCFVFVSYLQKYFICAMITCVVIPVGLSQVAACLWSPRILPRVFVWVDVSISGFRVT